MRIALLAACLLVAPFTPLIAQEKPDRQEIKPGDRVVAIEDIQIMQDGQSVAEISRGLPLDVTAVEGDRLHVKSSRSGWISASQVVTQDEAVEYFSELLKNDPTNRDDLYARAMVWLSIDKYDEAIADFTKRIELKAEFRDYNERGYCWMMKGEMDKAIADFNSAVDLAPEDARMRLNRGLAFKQAGDLQRALEDFNTAIQLDPELLGAYDNRALIALQNNDLVDAVRDFDVILRLNPHELRIRELRGRCLLNLGKPDQAITDFSEVLKQNPQNVNALFYRGDAYFTLGQHSHALQDYNQVLALLPDTPIVYFRRGRSHHAMGNLEMALQDLDEALSREPDNLLFLRERAQIREESAQYELAVNDLDRLLEQHPDHVHDLILRANCLQMLGRTADAIQDLSHAIKVDPNHQMAPLAHYIRGDLLRKQSEYAAAIEDFDRALAAVRSPEVLYARGKCFRQLGNAEQAVAGLQEAIAIDPDYLAALNDLAWMQATWPTEEIRNGEQAVAHARHACELTDWKHPALLDTLAAAFAEAGDFQSARKYLEEAAEVMPEDVQKTADIENKRKLYAAETPYREAVPEQKPAPATDAP